MLLMRVDGMSTLGYGESHVDFRIINGGYQATFVLGKKRLSKIAFKDLAQLQRFAAVCQEGVSIFPPRFVPG